MILVAFFLAGLGLLDSIFSPHSICLHVIPKRSYRKRIICAKINLRNGQNNTRCAGAARPLSWITWWAPCLGQQDVLQIEPGTLWSHGAAFKIDPPP